MASGGTKGGARRARIDRARRVRRYSLVGGAGAVLAAAVLVFALAPAPTPGATPCTSDRAGQGACAFTAQLANRQATFDTAAVSGPMLIEFMGSHCTTCQAQMPGLTQVVDTYRPQGLTVVSLDVGGVLGTEDPADAVAFMASNGADWDIALDNDAIAIDYGVVTLPTIFLVDSTGTVAFRTGYISADDLSAQVEALL